MRPFLIVFRINTQRNLQRKSLKKPTVGKPEISMLMDVLFATSWSGADRKHWGIIHNER
jgi:hypothetical protein